MTEITSDARYLVQTRCLVREEVYMHFVKINTKLVGTETSIATQDMESLLRRFESLQEEKLHTPARTSIALRDGTTYSNVQRLSVRIYYISASGGGAD